MSLNRSTTPRAFARPTLGRSGLTVVALSVLSLACGHDGKSERQASRTVADSVARLREEIAGGEVVTLPAATQPTSRIRWISDANALSLITALNARQIAAADFELENWRVDSVRAFAASMAREHAELQHAVDSIAAHLGLTPVPPALAKQWTAEIQAQIDTVRRAGDNRIDLAFVRQQANSHQLMSDRLSQLAAVTERPELQAFFERAASKAAAQAQRARSMQTFASSDSARRDAARSRGRNQ
jgi:predicted outer membrane protein